MQDCELKAAHVALGFTTGGTLCGGVKSQVQGTNSMRTRSPAITIVGHSYIWLSKCNDHSLLGLNSKKRWETLTTMTGSTQPDVMFYTSFFSGQTVSWHEEPKPEEIKPQQKR